MAAKQFDQYWEAVEQAFFTEFASALRSRNWAEVEGMATPEFADAIREGRWADVSQMGDCGNDVETTHLIRVAIGNSFDSEAAILDASRRGDRSHLAKVGEYQTQQRAKFITAEGRVAM